jgi:hypothetical protein
MDLGSIFLILALLVAVIIFVSRPLFNNLSETDRIDGSYDDHVLSSLMAERDQILDAIQELDFDHALDKIPDSEYPIQRQMLVDRGIEVLQILDDATSKDVLAENASAADFSSHLEAAIATRRQNLQDAETGTPAQSETRAIDPNDNLEYLIANRRRERKEKAAGFCPKCGGPVQKSDQFCPKCGYQLA